MECGLPVPSTLSVLLPLRCMMITVKKMHTSSAKTPTEPPDTAMMTVGEIDNWESVVTTIGGCWDGVGCGVVLEDRATTSLLLDPAVVVAIGTLAPAGDDGGG